MPPPNTIQPNPPLPDAGHTVIVAGYGLVGRAVAEGLESAGYVVTVIEMNLNTIEKQLDLDRDVVYGDATSIETLQKARVEHARALIITIPDEKAARLACETARQLAPDIFIAARANFVSMGMLCAKAGADHVTVEELVTAQAMQQAILEKLPRT